jgi:carotenoid cleavage dioxygenase
MAHIYEIANSVEYPYVDGRKRGNQVKFPNTPVFQTFNAPSRLEGDIFDLEISGTIPQEINGTFYRVQPDHRFPPVFEEDIHFSGDGSITAIQIQDGHADFKQRYVQTDKFKAEAAARKSLFGKYRNPYTDSESVKGVIRTVANTNITFWRGVLLASKEDGPPYALDPTTLETIGRYDFEGQVQSPTFTAHPKFDPNTGEMICFAYEAGGNGNDGSCDIVVYTIDANGKKTEEAWYKSPFCGMIHDCGISKNYVVLPLTPLKCSVDRLKQGGNHWAWDPNESQWYGIIPRRGGKPEDIVWLKSDNGGLYYAGVDRPGLTNGCRISRACRWLLRKRRGTCGLRSDGRRWECLLLFPTRWARCEYLERKKSFTEHHPSLGV